MAASGPYVHAPTESCHGERGEVWSHWDGNLGGPKVSQLTRKDPERASATSHAPPPESHLGRGHSQPPTQSTVYTGELDGGSRICSAARSYTLKGRSSLVVTSVGVIGDFTWVSPAPHLIFYLTARIDIYSCVRDPRRDAIRFTEALSSHPTAGNFLPYGETHHTPWTATSK